MKKNRAPEAAVVLNSFHFSLAGLILFCLALMGGASFVTWKLVSQNAPLSEDSFTLVNPLDNHSSLHKGPWGELTERDIELERPAEYLTEEVKNPPAEVWDFAGLDAAGVKALLVNNGLAADVVDRAFAVAPPGLKAGGGVAWQPPEDFLFSLRPEVRAKLYDALAGKGVYLYLDYPYIFPKNTIESIYTDKRLSPDDVAVLKQLAYPNGLKWELGDYDLLLRRIPTMARRVVMSQALSRQKAVLAGLVVRPDTDIDKIADYWGNIPNVRFTDIRPLFDSLKALPNGGAVSLVYLLPSFARNRLYTYPLPPQPGEPVMDCHWTTFNFSNLTPDNRFNDPDYAIKYINANYYPIAAPSMYGDVLLLMNDKNEIKHSAMFLADDLVYTKNGNNYRQPWMIMHIPDLLDTYPAYPPMRTVYLRLKVN